MKMRPANVNGEMGWGVDYGVRDGKRRREYYTDEFKAQSAYKDGLKDRKELGRRLSELHENVPIITR